MNLKTIFYMYCVGTMSCCQHFKQPSYINYKKVKTMLCASKEENRHRIHKQNVSTPAVQSTELQDVSIQGTVPSIELQDISIQDQELQERDIPGLGVVVQFKVRLHLKFKQLIEKIDLSNWHITASVKRKDPMDNIFIMRDQNKSMKDDKPYSALTSNPLDEKAISIVADVAIVEYKIMVPKDISSASFFICINNGLLKGRKHEVNCHKNSSSEVSDLSNRPLA